MTESGNCENSFYREIQLAVNARRSGSEGRARVCARRAAGIVVGKYLSRIDENFSDRGVYDNLRYFISLSQISPEYKETASYFVLRVDEKHNLPIDVDLIKEALKLKENLNCSDKDP